MDEHKSHGTTRSRFAATMDRWIFFSRDDGEAAQNDPAPLIPGAVAVIVALVLVGVAGWWFLAPPNVHRPSSAVWCSAEPGGTDGRRFDARAILGREYAEGHDLAARHGCTVRDVTDGRTDDGATGRVNVFVKRGIITQIDGVY